MMDYAYGYLRNVVVMSGATTSWLEVAAMDTLTRPDAYRYAVRAEAPLPVFRIRFTDEAHTRACMDTVTAELVGVGGRQQTSRRLFDLFHRRDLNFLLHASAARGLLIWFLSIAGVISSITAAYIGRLRLRLHRSNPTGKRLVVHR